MLTEEFVVHQYGTADGMALLRRTGHQQLQGGPTKHVTKIQPSTGLVPESRTKITCIKHIINMNYDTLLTIGY